LCLGKWIPQPHSEPVVCPRSFCIVHFSPRSIPFHHKKDRLPLTPPPHTHTRTKKNTHTLPTRETLPHVRPELGPRIASIASRQCARARASRGARTAASFPPFAGTYGLEMTWVSSWRLEKGTGEMESLAVIPSSPCPRTSSCPLEASPCTPSRR